MYTIKQDKTNVEIDVTISNEDWEKGTEAVYQKNKSKYVIAGFRKGHAPRKAIEKEYGDGVFFDETLEKFVWDTLDEIVHNNSEFEPVAQPSLEFESYSATEGTKFKIFIQIVPDFKLPKYKGLSIKTHECVSRLEISMQDEINLLLRDHSKFSEVDRASKKGDSVLIDFIGFIGNVEFEGGSAENYSLELGSHSFIEGFEDQLIGSKKGDTVDVKVKFPDDYPADEVAGKEATFKVTVKEVRERKMPEFNDKFVSDTTEFETVEEYKKDLEVRTKRKLQNTQDQDFRRNLIKTLGKNTEMDIPDTMVDSEAQRKLQYLTQIAQLYQMSIEEYISMTEHGLTFEQYKEKLFNEARDEIKHRYILRKIIKVENITCSQEELDEKLKTIDPERRNTLDGIHEAESSVLYHKVYDFLQANNKQDLADFNDNSF